jgi:hypothetical protein
MDLVQTMVDSCSFANEAEELKKRSERDQEIINQILRQVMECAYFIRDYCRDKSFGMWNPLVLLSLGLIGVGRSQTHCKVHSFSCGRTDR